MSGGLKSRTGRRTSGSSGHFYNIRGIGVTASTSVFQPRGGGSRETDCRQAARRASRRRKPASQTVSAGAAPAYRTNYVPEVYQMHTCLRSGRCGVRLPAGTPLSIPLWPTQKGTRLVNEIMRAQRDAATAGGSPFKFNLTLRAFAMTTPFQRLTTRRLVMRLWQPADEPLFVEAVAESLEPLRTWLPWARAPLEAHWHEMEKFLARPESASDLIYGVFDSVESRVLGGVGIHLRNGDDDREIGYWLRADAVGLGYMSEAVAALTDEIFKTLPVSTVTIVCDPLNIRSASVPARLGFENTGIFPPKVITPDRTEDMIWRATREAWLCRNTGRVV